MRIERRIGPGDRQHARADELNVFLVSAQYMAGQLQATILAAQKLGMKAKCYLNLEGQDRAAQAQIDSVMKENLLHNVMELGNCTRGEFEFIVTAADLIVYEPFEGMARMTNALLEVWTKNGGRFTEGNHQGYTLSELWAMFPQFFLPNDEAYKLYST